MSLILLQYKRLLTHLIVLLGFYTIFRAGFLLFNSSEFQELSLTKISSFFFYGLRFDISVILLLNSLFIFLFLIPFPILRYNFFQIFLRLLFIIVNGVALLFEVADWLYFPFNHKRSTAGVLDMVSRKGDFLNLLPSFLKDFWYAFLIAFVLIFLLWKSYRKVEKYYKTKAQLLIFVDKKEKIQNNWLALGVRILMFILGTGFCIIGLRGGFQLIPINNRNAVEVVKSEYAPIVLNTSFSIINSLTSVQLQAKHFMSEKQAFNMVQPIKQYPQTQAFDRKNVVVIILESFSKEFTKYGPGESYTPFLDSLMNESMVFTNAFSNGLHSAEGIPAVISSIPSLMSEALSFSTYSNNEITAFPTLLHSLGYNAAFFHGGTNGTMSFDIFAKSAGYNRYFGRTEYNNEKDYDGTWGIFDEPFLQFFAKKMDTQKQPFFNSVFTVTSHQPYPIPEQYKNRFANDKLPIENAIRYSDFALQQFFKKIRTAPWFKNTLFIITPDHCSPMSSNAYYGGGTGRYEIPIIFYAPNDPKLKGENNTLMQQIDIMPSVLDYLHYDKPFFSFGNSVFRKQPARFVINQLSGVFHWINDGTQMVISEDKVQEVYAFPSDTLREINLLKQPNYHLDSTSFKYWQAFIQVYNNAMIKNKMTASSYK